MLLKKHGGVREDAYTKDINLAYPLEDGMKIYIPTKQEKENTTISEVVKDGVGGFVIDSSGVSIDNKKMENSREIKVNINTATQAQLETLPGIGPSTATKILAYRKEKGKFTKIEDIKEVSGIGDSKFDKIKDYITVK